MAKQLLTVKVPKKRTMTVAEAEMLYLKARADEARQRQLVNQLYDEFHQLKRDSRNAEISPLDLLNNQRQQKNLEEKIADENKILVTFCLEMTKAESQYHRLKNQLMLAEKYLAFLDETDPSDLEGLHLDRDPASSKREAERIVDILT